MRIISVMFLLSIALSSRAQIKISSQKNIKFSDYKSFVVQKGQIVSLLKDNKINENKLFEVLKKSISGEMKLKGFEVADDSTAQLVISYFYEENNESNYQKPGPLGQTPTQDPTYVDESERSVIIRTLIIEIEDRKDKSSLWTATCSLGRSQKEVYTLIDMTVITAFKKFKSSK